MCIRYELDFEKIVGGWSRKLVLRELLGVGDKRLEMFPARRGPIIWNPTRKMEVVEAQWGFIPGWAKDPSFGKKSGYNARSETVTHKPTWRGAFKNQRCIVPATAFYERANGRWLRFRAVEDLLPIAALYEPPNKHSSVPTFSLVTTAPNAMVADAHDRMPVVLGSEDIDRWLDPNADLAELGRLFVPCPEAWLTVEDAGPVSRKATSEPSQETGTPGGAGFCEIVANSGRLSQ